MAHSVDGGLLCSQFTLNTFLELLEPVTDSGDDAILKRELLYLLNPRKTDGRHERNDEPITSAIKNIVSSSPGEYQYNERVMMTLIEAGYIQQEFSFINPAEYTNFLKYILLNSERTNLKEAACRQIIKLFGPDKKQER